MDAYGIVLRLKMGVQIRYNTLCMQGARGSSPSPPPAVITPEETVNCGGLFVWLLTPSLSLLTKVLTTPMYRWYKSFRHGLFPLSM
jgi:hypothetical protein